MPKALLNRAAQIALVVAVLTLLAVGAVSYRGLVLSEDSEQRVRHTHEVLEGLEGLLAATQSVESSARGFALTGEASYLPAFQSGVARSRQYEDTAAQAGRGQPGTAAAPRDARRAWSRRRSGSANRSSICDGRSGLEAAAAAIGTGTGQRLMQELEAVVGHSAQRRVAIAGAAQRRCEAAPAPGEVRAALRRPRGPAGRGGRFRERPARQLATPGDRGGAARERREVPDAPRRRPGLRDLHDGPEGRRAELERRCRTDQGLLGRRDSRSQLRLLLPPGRRRARAAGGTAPHDGRERQAGGTGPAHAARRVAVPGPCHSRGVARPGRTAAGFLRDQPRPQREHGIRGAVSRAARSRAGRDGGGEHRWRDRAAERPGGEAVRLPPRRAASDSR